MSLLIVVLICFLLYIYILVIGNAGDLKWPITVTFIFVVLVLGILAGMAMFTIDKQGESAGRAETVDARI